MPVYHLSIRIDFTPDYYYPFRDSISPLLRVIIEKCHYIIRKLVMCEEIARKTKKVHCHIAIEYDVPSDRKLFKSISQKLIRELNKGDDLLPPRQFSISSKPVKDVMRFMRYPLKEQEDLSNTVHIGYDDNPFELEIQRRLAFEERLKTIALWEKSNSKKEQENNTFQELVDYLGYMCPIETSHQDYSFERNNLERIGSKIVQFYRVYKKSKLPFNIDKILFRYLLHCQLATDLEIFQLMSHIR